jgi:hypothetical protein
VIWRVCYLFASLHATACYPESYPDEETCRIFGRLGFELVMDSIPGSTRAERNRIWAMHHCEQAKPETLGPTS